MHNVALRQEMVHEQQQNFVFDCFRACYMASLRAKDLPQKIEQSLDLFPFQRIYVSPSPVASPIACKLTFLHQKVKQENHDVVQ